MGLSSSSSGIRPFARPRAAKASAQPIVSLDFKETLYSIDGVTSTTLAGIGLNTVNSSFTITPGLGIRSTAGFAGVPVEYNSLTDFILVLDADPSSQANAIAVEFGTRAGGYSGLTNGENRLALGQSSFVPCARFKDGSSGTAVVNSPPISTLAKAFIGRRGDQTIYGTKTSIVVGYNGALSYKAMDFLYIPMEVSGGGNGWDGWVRSVKMYKGPMTDAEIIAVL
jgi:hypothetical protein